MSGSVHFQFLFSFRRGKWRGIGTGKIKGHAPLSFSFNSEVKMK
jgi:hypothetical protein